MVIFIHFAHIGLIISPISVFVESTFSIMSDVKDWYQSKISSVITNTLTMLKTNEEEDGYIHTNFSQRGKERADEQKKEKERVLSLEELFI
jgi:hypothetical protein